MGLEPFNVASAINCLTAQRLLRRICSNCKVEAPPYDDVWLKAGNVDMEWYGNNTMMKGEGCDTCGGTGYKGRAGLYEVMLATPAIRKAIMDQVATDDLREVALSEGMLTLRMDGYKKAERGITTLEEVVKETTTDE
jgi:type IV pilus assembly protein PilB